MNVNKTIVRFFMLLILLLISVPLSLLFPAFFNTQNARINDYFFRLRFMLWGCARISPYLIVYNLEDDLDRTTDSNITLQAVIDRLWNQPVCPEIKTLIVNITPPGQFTFHNEDNEEYKPGQDAAGSRQLVFPSLIVNRQPGPQSPAYILAVETMRFYPRPHIRGPLMKVDGHDFSFVLPELSGTQQSTGIANLYPDKDGVVRRLPLFFFSEDGYYYPSLFFAGLCRYFGVNPVDIQITGSLQITLPHARFRGEERNITIPVDERGQMIINFPGPFNASFNRLSAARLLQSGEKQEAVPLAAPPGSLTLLGDISITGGKFSAGIYDPVYPDNFILASALNTVLTGNYLRPAAPVENCLLYLPAIVLLTLFMNLMAKRSLKFFMIGLPVIYLVILLLVFCLHLFLFIGVHCLPALLQLLAGLLCTIFLLIGFRLLDIENREFSPAQPDITNQDNTEPEAVPAVSAQDLQLPPISETELICALSAYKIITERQVKTALPLLKGKTYKEIADELCISEAAVGQRTSKIYKKCGVNNRFSLIDKIYKSAMILHQKPSIIKQQSNSNQTAFQKTTTSCKL